MTMDIILIFFALALVAIIILLLILDIQIKDIDKNITNLWEAYNEMLKRLNILEEYIGVEYERKPRFKKIKDKK